MSRSTRFTLRRANRQGDIGWVTRAEDGGVVNPDIESALFGMESIGELSQPIATGRGWEVLLFSGTRDAVRVEDIAPGLAQWLARNDARAEVNRTQMDAWAEEAEVEIVEDAAQALRDARPGEPVRPRRLEIDGLARGMEMVAGTSRVEELREEHRAPNTRFANPPIAEGSGTLPPAPSPTEPE